MTIYNEAAVMLLAGLALFLLGLRFMQEKLERALGRNLRFTVKMMGKNRVAAWLGGMLASLGLQSSTGLSVAVAGLASVGCISLQCAAGALLGANIGSAAAALWLALDVRLGTAAAVAGALLCIVFRRERTRQLGGALIALAIVMIGLEMVSQALQTLKDWEGMTYLMLGMGYPVLAVLLGAGVAAMLQSSVAVVALAQVLALQALLPLETAIYVVLGANIGTCFTAIIASAGARVPGRRAAAVHLMAKLIGVAAGVAAMQYLPVAEYAALAGGNAKWQLALLHGALNVTTAVVLLPFAGLLCAISKLFVRGAQEESTLAFYDERVLYVPAFALLQLEKETQRLCAMSCAQLQYAADCWQGEVFADAPDEMSRDVKKMVTEGLLSVAGRTGNPADQRRVTALMHAAQQAGGLDAPAKQLVSLRAECINALDEEAADDLRLLLHKALNMANMAQQVLFGGRMSDEKLSSMRLMTGEAKECAHEARLKMLHNSCDEVYLEALREAARAAVCAGEMLQNK